MSAIRTSAQQTLRSATRAPALRTLITSAPRSYANSTTQPHKAASTTAPDATKGSGEASSNPLGPSRTPIYLAGVAALVVAGYYSFSNSTPPKTQSVENIEKALSPKIAANEGAKPSEGLVKRT